MPEESNPTNASERLYLGIDTGGTFTDFVLVQGGSIRVHKVLSTPGAPQRAIMQGINDLGLTKEVGRGLVNIIHGTTVATNATLEGKGVRTAYITNKGMKDVLSIGRQTRLELYNLAVTKKTITPEEDLLFEVDVRCAADGAVIKELDASELAALTEEVRRAEPEAIAVNLLFSFVNDEHERLIEAALAKDFFVSRSSAVLPEYREYERGVATWVNAWLGPIINDYLLALSKSLEPSQVAIMQSSGLTIAAAQAAGKAVNLLLSGPAGGLAAAQMLARLTGKSQLMTFDMGGTSTDVSLLQDGIRLSSENHIAGLPIAIPMADIHTIGAGGGSIAYVDEGGLLQVGPHSAGADPGPACYGLGGKDATVTDANLLLGRLNPDAFLRGEMALDMDAANAAVNRVAQQLGLTVKETAQGIVDIASELMAQALRVISIERGHDPRDYTLVCFGGAGGMHLCQLAETLEITEAIVPVHAGVLSALGMLATKPGREMTRTHRMLLDATNADADAYKLAGHFQAMEALALAELAKEGVTQTINKRSFDLRYQGQTFTLNLPFVGAAKPSDAVSAFHQAHEERYGHRLERDVELVNLRVHIEAETQPMTLPDWQAKGLATSSGINVVPRSSLGLEDVITGPCLITEDHATTYVAEGWRGRLDRYGNLLLQMQV